MTEMYPSTPIATLIGKSGLILAHIMLNFWQRMYTYRFFSLSESILTENIVFMILQMEDRNSQQEDQPKIDSIWASNQHITTCGQQFACQISVTFSIDQAKRTEPIQTILSSVFQGEFIIKDIKKSLLEVNQEWAT